MNPNNQRPGRPGCLRLFVKPISKRVSFAALRALAIASIAATSAFAASFSQPAAKNAPDLFAWTDTCNVYVLRDGDAALLIDLGDGSVLDHLSEIGVKRVEWVLFTTIIANNARARRSSVRGASAAPRSPRPRRSELCSSARWISAR